MRQWQSYYLRWFEKVFRSAWPYCALVSGVFAIGIRYLQDKHSVWVPTVNHWAWLIPSGLFLVLGFFSIFIAPYLLYKEDKAGADAAESKSKTKIEELVAKVGERPELEILFDDKNNRYFKDYAFGSNMPEVMVRLYKVAVRGKGGLTVEDVNLDLVGIEPPPSNSSELPLPLHPVHGATAYVPGVQYGALHPETLRFFDVIQMPANGSRQIYPSSAPVNFQFPRGRYVLKLRANGKNAIPAERLFVTEVGIMGELKFYSQI